MSSVPSADQALPQCLEKLGSSVAMQEPSEMPTFMREAASISECDPLDWLERQPAGNRIYWQDRNGETTAGAGAAHLISGDAGDCAKALLSLYLSARGELTGIRYFGGLSFGKTAMDELWAPFTRCRFQLPQITLTRDSNGKCELSALHLHNAPAAASPLQPSENNESQPSLHQVPDAVNWRKQVTEALRTIKTGELQKVVLAGRTATPVPDGVDGFSILRTLRDQSTDAFVFAFEPAPGVMLIGASPERLYRRDGLTLSTEALAGTRRRGVSPEEDTALADELLRSDKDLREHQFVVDELLADLSPLCESVTSKEAKPQLLRQATIQHLVQHIQGTLRRGVLDQEIIRAIHPTPAVGGQPRAKALEFISEVEPFARGWYAAPVGWLSPQSAEFAVAIRSALISKGTLYTFAGAGIVTGSNPAQEWDEIQQKQNLILDALEKAQQA